MKYNIENNIIDYDVEINSKVESTIISANNEPTTNSGEKINSPNKEAVKKTPKTRDDIINYISLLIISIIGIIIVVLYKKRNRKKDNNEKDI